MEVDCHNRSVDRYKKGNVLSYGRYDRFYRYIGVNFTFGLLYCDCHIGDIVISWIVKPGFCSKHRTVTLAG